VLDFGGRWVAIDPKGFLGHRAFDYANVLCNPSLAAATDNLAERIDTIISQADTDRRVLARWTVAWCGLSLVWHDHDASPSWHAAVTQRVGETLLCAV
jgi:streptomycin 6-kinase